VARYFFYIVNQGRVVPDQEGDEFPDLESAKEEAIASARDVARQEIAEHRSLKDACIEIHDDHGRILASVSVHEVLDNPEVPGFGEHCGTLDQSERLH
jgi:hypothetical protein